MKIKYYLTNLFILLLHIQINYIISNKIPILLFHGVTSSPESFNVFTPKLQELGHVVIAIDCFTKEKSIISLWEQIEGTINWIRLNVHTNPIFQNGYHAIGYSQGAMILRGIAQMMPDHHIKHLITLGGPLNGFYFSQKNDVHKTIATMRKPHVPKEFMKILAILSEHGVLQDVINFVSKRHKFQELSSILNLWHVPTNVFYYKNEFLPILNNNYHKDNKGLLNPFFVKMNSTDQTRKDYFLKIDTFYSLYSPQDEVINPTASATFGYFKDVDKKEDAFEIIPMENTPEYIHDLYGLKTLNEQNRLIMINIPNIIHACWVSNSTCNEYNELFTKHIVPLLN